MSYVRDTIGDYIKVCVNLSSERANSEELSKRIVGENDEHIVTETTNGRIRDLLAQLVALETRIELLFKPESRDYELLEPVLLKMSEAATERTPQDVCGFIGNLKDATQKILDDQWRDIESRLKLEP